MSEPKPYDVSDPEEVKRLHQELLGYMRVSALDGTDLKGRQYAIDALNKLAELEKCKFCEDNPLVALTLWFKDGTALRQVFNNPVPQVKAMKALGHIVAELGGELNIQLEG